MSQQYNPIVNDEILYWFDVLQDNSLNNISNITGIHRDKVRKVLTFRLELRHNPTYAQKSELIDKSLMLCKS